MSSIKVAVRCRPLFEQERPAAGLDIQGRRILLDAKTYDPDYTFPPTSTQDDVFAACRPILQCVKDGLNGTLMVYGQTGTGKTYTMLGNDGQDNGLVHMVIAHMLDHVQAKTVEGVQCALTLSMIEIYNEKLTDMLSEGGDAEVGLVAGFPRNANRVTLARLADANDAVRKGLAVRHTAATMMNERSSRSHVVFIVDLAEYNAFTEETDVAHLFMVDLAGSESIKKSQATGATAGEAGKINKSLLALKSVFLALSNTNEATRPTHVPYRDSRLTELLQDSIGGTARTLMIACISSVGRDIEETKSTLMYAVRARSIRNAANTEREKLQIRLRSMEVENQRLRNRLQERVNERGGYYVTREEHDKYEVMEAESRELRESVEQLLKDSQASDARKHISESQTKILQGMVTDKEEELQRFKNMYSEALQRFERNASALQRVVQAAVGDAQTVLQASAAQQHGQVIDARRRLMALLEAPLPLLNSPKPTADPLQLRVVENENEEASGSRSTAPSPLLSSTPTLAPSSSSAAVSPQRITKPSSTRASAIGQQQQQQQQQQEAGTRPASPARRGARSTGASARRGGGAVRDRAEVVAKVLELEMVDAPLPPPASAPVAVPAAPPALTFLEEADEACRRISDGVNAAFTALLEQLVAAYDSCDAAMGAAAATRAELTEGVCARLRGHVEECIAQLAAADRRATEDIDSASEAFRGRLRIAAGQYSGGGGSCGGGGGPCDPQPLRHVVRNACVAVAREAGEAAPPPGPPAEVRSALDRVSAQFQAKAHQMFAGAIAPLASLDARPQVFGDVLATSAQQQQRSVAVAATGAGGGDGAVEAGQPVEGLGMPPLAPLATPVLSQTGQAQTQQAETPTHAPMNNNNNNSSMVTSAPGSPPSGGASTVAAGSPAGPPPLPRPHSRTASYSKDRDRDGSARGTTAAAGPRHSGPPSLRSSLRAQTSSRMNASPSRPLGKKRTRSSLPSGRGGPSSSQDNNNNSNNSSSRRAPAARAERK